MSPTCQKIRELLDLASQNKGDQAITQTARDHIMAEVAKTGQVNGNPIFVMVAGDGGIIVVTNENERVVIY